MTDAQQNALLTKLANVEDEATGDAFELFEYKKVGNKRGQVLISRDKGSEKKAVQAALLRKNAIPEAASSDAVELALAAKPRERRLMVRQLGWRPDKSAFVTAKGTIGAPRKRKLYPPISLNDKHHVRLGEHGSFEGWRYGGLAYQCFYSDIAVLAVAASFAAPLLDFVGMQSFGINIFGPSKVGKSTALLAATSVFGIGKEERLPNWSATRSSREEIAPFFNDLLFPANEMGGLTGRKQDSYGAIREFIYRICEGTPPAKNSASIFATPAHEYKTIFLSTSEHSIDWYARAARAPRDAGEYARCVDVPATVPGCPSIMNRPIRMVKRLRKAWSRKAIIRLRQACEVNYGYALSPYIEFLIEHKRAVPNLVRGYMDEFLEDPRMAQTDPAFAHAAKNFALIYAGGRLAMDAKVLPPHRRRRLERSLISCFQRAMTEIGNRQTDEEIARQILKDNVATITEASVTDGSAVSQKGAPGYRKEFQGKHRYVIHAEAFRNWFGQDRVLVNAALHWLTGEKLLRVKATTKPLSVNSVEWAVTTPKWPNGKSVRSIVFDDPFPTSGK